MSGLLAAMGGWFRNAADLKTKALWGPQPGGATWASQADLQPACDLAGIAEAQACWLPVGRTADSGVAGFTARRGRA